jgi:hypothetical protein
MGHAESVFFSIQMTIRGAKGASNATPPGGGMGSIRGIRAVSAKSTRVVPEINREAAKSAKEKPRLAHSAETGPCSL